MRWSVVYTGALSAEMKDIFLFIHIIDKLVWLACIYLS